VPSGRSAFDGSGNAVAGLIRSIGTPTDRNAPAIFSSDAASTYQKQTSSEPATMVSTTSMSAPPSEAATGLAFAKSGNLYVSLLGPNQITVLNPAGDEIGRISDPRFHSPWGLAFSGKSLLVTNGDLEPGDNPDAWKIFKVYVGETGLPLIRPKTTGNCARRHTTTPGGRCAPGVEFAVSEGAMAP
jgi:hypothetical protein